MVREKIDKKKEAEIMRGKELREFDGNEGGTQDARATSEEARDQPRQSQVLAALSSEGHIPPVNYNYETYKTLLRFSSQDYLGLNFPQLAPCLQPSCLSLLL